MPVGGRRGGEGSGKGQQRRKLAGAPVAASYVIRGTAHPSRAVQPRRRALQHPQRLAPFAATPRRRPLPPDDAARKPPTMASARANSSTPVPTTEKADPGVDGTASSVTEDEYKAMTDMLTNIYNFRNDE
jgi:hypothetical protein